MAGRKSTKQRDVLDELLSDPAPKDVLDELLEEPAPVAEAAEPTPPKRRSRKNKGEEHDGDILDLFGV